MYTTLFVYYENFVSIKVRIILVHLFVYGVLFQILIISAEEEEDKILVGINNIQLLIRCTVIIIRYTVMYIIKILITLYI